MGDRTLRLGGYVGYPGGLGYSVVGGYMVGKSDWSRETVEDYLEARAVTVGGGFYGGVNGVYSPGSGKGFEI